MPISGCRFSFLYSISDVVVASIGHCRYGRCGRSGGNDGQEGVSIPSVTWLAMMGARVALKQYRSQNEQKDRCITTESSFEIQRWEK